MARFLKQRVTIFLNISPFPIYYPEISGSHFKLSKVLLLSTASWIYYFKFALYRSSGHMISNNTTIVNFLSPKADTWSRSTVSIFAALTTKWCHQKIWLILNYNARNRNNNKWKKNAWSIGKISASQFAHLTNEFHKLITDNTFKKYWLNCSLP